MPESGERQRELYEEWAGKCVESFQRLGQEKGTDLLSYFSCQGAPSPPIEAFIHSAIVTDDDEWRVYLTEVGNPLQQSRWIPAFAGMTPE
jgi:hypothetical protein